MTRRERIRRLDRIASLAKRTTAELAVLEPVPLLPELGHHLRTLSEAARIAAALAEREMADLEGARDWGGGPMSTLPCSTSGVRLSDPAIVLEPGEEDRPGGRVRCLRCGRVLALIQGRWLRAVVPEHEPAAEGGGE